MLSGFREFILRGNVIDLAVAVVIGAAFGTVVNTFVSAVLAPLLTVIGIPPLQDIGFFTPNGAFVAVGVFIDSVIYFLLVAAAIYFFVVRPVNALEERRQRDEEEAPTTQTCPECASEIPAAARRCPMCAQPLHTA
jgi:large conductance mechanosensitive channel